MSGVVLVFALMLLGGTAIAAAPARPAPVRVGAAGPIPAGAHAAGALPATTPLRLTVALKPRDPAALAAAVTAISTPGSPSYRQYLRPSQFAARYGATPATIAAVTAALRADGLDPGAPTANGLSIPVSAPAGTVAQAFSTSFQRVTLADGDHAFANTSAPALPADVAQDVQVIVGLSDTAAPHHAAIQRVAATGAARGGDAQPRVATGGPQPCSSLKNSTAYVYSSAADDIASSYGVPGLYAASDFGAGQKVAIVEFEGNFPADITAFKNCYTLNGHKLTTSVTYPQVDGGPPAPSTDPKVGDGVETELDIETVIGLAPAAAIEVYQAPNDGSYDLYQQIVDDDTANVISSSWGFCEPLANTAYFQGEQAILQQAAMEGMSVFSAAGDDGSDDCGNSTDAVDDPGSQPNVTSVGGTTFTAYGPPPSETVWNNSSGIGGGGVSEVWTMPAYQSQAASALGLINAQSSATPCGASTGQYCREVPDVSANADPGYVVYYGLWSGDPDYNSPWGGVDGTSFAAPEWAAFTALANASAACDGTPVGEANPALYSAAGSDYAADFNDITAGDNGTFNALSAFDEASGLGTPDVTPLAAELCDPVGVTNPGAQSATAGATISPLQLAANDRAADTSFTYTVNGLPPGLSASSSGQISGTPTTAGAFPVDVIARNAAGHGGATTFTWTVASAPAPPVTTSTTSPTTTQAPTSGAPGTTSTPGTSPVPTSTTPLVTPTGNPGLSKPAIAFSKGKNVLSFTTGSGGTLKIALGGKSTSISVSGPGTHTISLTLSKKLKRKLHRARRHKLTVNVTLTFTPTGGRPQTTRSRFTLHG